MIRDKIKSLIKEIVPCDELEKKHQKQVIEWIDSGVEIFRIQKPDVPPQHLVAYFVVYNPLTRKILIGEHIKSGLLLPNGGHIELNELPHLTVTREAQEELNIIPKIMFDDKPIFISIAQTVGVTSKHFDVSLWYVVEHKNEIIDFDKGEYKSMTWYSLDDVLKINIQSLDEHMYRFVRKFMILCN